MANYKVVHFDKIPSTQTYARELILGRHANGRMAIVADVQTAGHGRYRRTWVSPNGNLYVSFIFQSPDRDSRISYWVAVAVAETLIEFGMQPQIKWPNDILIDGKKISGILIEYCADFVIVGIGINVASCPNIPEYQTAKCLDYVNVTKNDVFGRLTRNMDKWMRADFSVVRNRWMDLAIGINADVKYQGAMATLIGLNDNGALVLRRGSKYLMVYGDEIVI